MASVIPEPPAPPTAPEPCASSVTYSRVRGEIMGSPKCRIAAKSQSVLILIDPMIFTRTRSDNTRARKVCVRESVCVWGGVGSVLPTLLAWPHPSAPPAPGLTAPRARRTCPKRLVIEVRWGSKPLAFAGKLQPRRLIK